MRGLKAALAFVLLWAAMAARAQSATNTSLTITANGGATTSVREGTAVTLTAAVTLVSSGGAAAAPGQVEFCEVKPAPLECTDIRLLGTAQLLANGTASLKFFPGPGTHSYQARFLGTHIEAASASSAITVIVTPYYPTSTSLVATGPAGDYTIAATVTAFGGTDPPTGTVSFLDGNNADYALAAPGVLVPGPSVHGLEFAYTSPQFASAGPFFAAGDFDGDGKADLAVIANPLTPPNTMSILLGNGDGTFAVKSTVALGPPGLLVTSYSAALADFNGDGRADIALSLLGVTESGQPSNSIQILLNNGDGTFTAGQTIPLDSSSNIATGDFNHDGIADLVVEDAATGCSLCVSILLGNGDGTFAHGANVPIPTSAGVLTVGDFNGDGNSDVALLNFGEDRVTILLGDGAGNLTPTAISPSTSPDPVSIVAADFNGDGTLDLAIANGLSSPNSVAVLLGNGDGTFTPAAPIVTPTLDGTLAVGDFDSDGKADLASAGFGSGGDFVSLLLGNGDGTFLASRQYPSDKYFASSLAMDFNGDGLSDVAVASSDGQVAVLLSSLGSSATATVSGVSIVGTDAHTVEASYSGDGMDQPSSGTVSLTAEPVPTTLALNAAPANAGYGQAVTLTAAVAPNTPQQDHLPTGAVTFQDGGTTLGSAMVSNGVAALTVSTLPAGSDSLTAAYSGDTNFTPSTASATEVVSGYASSASLTVKPNPAGVGEAVTLTAAVGGVGTTIMPTGSVSFFDGAAQIGAAVLDATGHASLSTSALALGTHTLTASYAGDAVFHAAVSAAVAEVIVEPDFTVTLGSPSISLAAYQNTTTTVTLASVGAFADSVALSCGNAPQYVTCIFTPQPAALAANATATVSFYLDTDSVVGGYGRSGPLARARSSSARRARMELLFAPMGLLAAFGLWRRRRAAGILSVGICMLAGALALSSCAANHVVGVPSVTPGTYVIAVTATGEATHTTHTANLTLTVTTAQ